MNLVWFIVFIAQTVNPDGSQDRYLYDKEFDTQEECQSYYLEHADYFWESASKVFDHGEYVGAFCLDNETLFSGPSVPGHYEGQES